MKNKKILLCSTLILLMLGLLGCGPKRVDLMDIATVKYTGIDGEGKASVHMEWKEVESYLNSNVNAKKGINLLSIVTLEDSVEYSLDKKENLSNGDKIELTVTYNKKLAKDLGLNLRGKSKKIKVEGLKEAVDIDLFSDIEVDFNGVSPFGKAEIRNTSSNSFLKSVRYEIVSDSNIKKEDTVKVKANYSTTEAEEEGYRIKETTKEYTVDEIDEYITDVDSIDEETMAKIESHSKDLINASFAKDNYYMYIYNSLSNAAAKFNSSYSYLSTLDKSTIKVNSIDLEKKYFLSLKAGQSRGYSSEKSNKLYMVYKVNVTDNCFPESTTVYVPIYFNDIIKRTSGDIDMVLTDGKMQKGYDNLDNVYRESVTADKDKYDYNE